MSNDERDNDNPFAPSRQRDLPPGPAERGRRSLEDLLSDDENDDYRLDFRADDYDYDPDEILDDEEEPEASSGWPRAESAPAPSPAHTGATPAATIPPPADTDADGEPEDDDWPDELEDGEQDPEDDGDGDYDDEWEEDPEDDEPGWMQNWPLGMIAIAVVALVLLAIGGFGVMQERAQMQEQIRELQSSLAVAADPEEVATERSAQRELVQRNERLAAQVDALQLENRQLNDTVRGLEQQLEVQQEAANKATTAPASKASPRAGDTAPTAGSETPAPAPEARPAPTATPSATGNWFVNFGSYSQRSLAESWSKRLKPASGRVIISGVPDSDLYRVRVIALPDRETAQAVAASLQEQYGLSKLWVGEE